MNIGYLTAPRPCDIRSLRWSQVTDSSLTLTARKTKKVQVFSMSPELADAIAQCKARPILGLYVIATDKGRPVSAWTMQTAWNAACAAAGVSGAQFRDIRAKAIGDAEELGQDGQKLGAHSNRSVTERHYLRRKVSYVEPVRKKL